VIPEKIRHLVHKLTPVMQLLRLKGVKDASRKMQKMTAQRERGMP
jgi:hypothetical protein